MNTGHSIEPNSSGSRSFSSPPSSNEFSTNTLQPVQSTPDIQQTNFLNSDTFVVQQFESTHQKWKNKEYLADPSLPILQLPDPEGATAPTPFPPSWQKATNQFFKDQVKEIVFERIKESQGINPSSKEKMDEATFQLIYNQHREKVNTLLQAMSNGRSSNLKEEDQAILSLATEKTRAMWGLPPSWKIGTQEASDWTPIQANASPPIPIDLQQQEILAQNLEQLCLSLDAAGAALLEQIPKETSQAKGVGDLIKIIAKALRDLKELLQTMQIQDSDLADKFLELKYDQIEVRKKEIEDNKKKQKEIARAQRKRQDIAKFMKIFAPIVSAIIVIAGAVAAVFTLGAGAPLIYAGILVGTVMLSYTIVDGELNLTSQGMEGLNKMFDKLFPHNKTGEQIFKIFIIIVVIAVLAAAMAASGGAAGGSFASQVAQESVKQLTIQTSMMFIMSSNILPDIVCQALIKSGAIKADDEKALMIIKMVVMLVTMLATMGALGYSESMRGGLSKFSLEETTNAIKSQLSNLSKISLENASQATLDALSALITGLREAIPSPNLKAMLAGGTDLLNFGYMTSQETMDFERFCSQIRDLSKVVQLGTQGVTSAYVADVGFNLAKLLKELGGLEKAQEVTQLLIKLFEDLLNSFQNGLSSNSQWLNNLNGAISAVYGSATQIIDKATRG